MAELAIIALAAIVAPALVAVLISVRRRVGAIAPPRQQMRESARASRPWASPPGSAKKANEVVPERSGSDDVRYCQMCGHVTLAHATYCRVCGSLLDTD